MRYRTRSHSSALWLGTRRRTPALLAHRLVNDGIHERLRECRAALRLRVEQPEVLVILAAASQ